MACGSRLTAKGPRLGLPGTEYVFGDSLTEDSPNGDPLLTS